MPLQPYHIPLFLITYVNIVHVVQQEDKCGKLVAIVLYYEENCNINLLKYVCSLVYAYIKQINYLGSVSLFGNRCFTSQT